MTPLDLYLVTATLASLSNSDSCIVPSPLKGDLCKTPVYLLEETIFSVIPVKLAPYSDTGTGI